MIFPPKPAREFNADARNRIGALVRASERRPDSPAIPPRNQVRGIGLRPSRWGYITTAAPARTGSGGSFTLGMGGVATMLGVNEDGTTFVEETGVAIANGLTVEIAADDDALIGFVWFDGHWLPVLGDCPVVEGP